MGNVSNNLNLKYRYSCHVLMNFEYSGRGFQKVLKYQISRKTFFWEPICSMTTDRRRDGQKWRS